MICSVTCLDSVRSHLELADSLFFSLSQGSCILLSITKCLFSFFFSFFIFSGRIIKIFCWFLLYISMGQAWVYILTPPAPSHPSNLSQSTSLSSLSHIASSHWLSVLHVFVYIFPCYSPFTPPSSYTPNSLYYCVTPYYCALPACQL